MYCLNEGEFKMSESKAFVLFLAALLLISGAMTVVCIKVGAGGAVVGLVFGLSCAAGGYFSAVIVMHYADVEKRRKREEILLSR
jgi:membrane protein CcdC involved in cytochrome C biogenesis